MQITADPVPQPRLPTLLILYWEILITEKMEYTNFFFLEGKWGWGFKTEAKLSYTNVSFLYL